MATTRHSVYYCVQEKTFYAYIYRSGVGQKCKYVFVFRVFGPQIVVESLRNLETTVLSLRYVRGNVALGLELRVPPRPKSAGQ